MACAGGPVPAATTAPKVLAHAADLPPHYRGILLDQFGVLHDGRTPYPGAVDAVRALAEDGRRLVVLSNSSRRSDVALAKLGALGFDSAWFVGAVTSGEVAHTRLRDRPGPFWRGLGSRVLHITWGARGGVSLDGLGLTLVGDDVGSADFILVHGTQALGLKGGGLAAMTLDELKEVLATAARLPSPPPLLCANPDFVTVDGGELRTMPGTLARWYDEAGGVSVLLGKPAPEIYSAALELLGLPPAAVLGVGDSLEHDVAGATAAGVDCVFVGGGIHAAVLGLDGAGGGGLDSGALGDLLRGRPAAQMPKFVMPYFVP